MPASAQGTGRPHPADPVPPYRAPDGNETLAEPAFNGDRGPATTLRVAGPRHVPGDRLRTIASVRALEARRRRSKPDGWPSDRSVLLSDALGRARRVRRALPQESLADPPSSARERPIHRRPDVDTAVPWRRPRRLGRSRLDHVPRLVSHGGAQRRRDRRPALPGPSGVRRRGAAPVRAPRGALGRPSGGAAAGLAGDALLAA